MNADQKKKEKIPEDSFEAQSGVEHLAEADG
jgi:hypothetical protein